MKKLFTKICLNNWGGISHKVLELNEYVNLFSGMSGSGKSTVMDAIQVVLYGSLSSNFLNKAADDAKNRRSVMSYLRGEQKDGSANREGQDFHTILALEVKDTKTQIINSVGVLFEVRKNDTELRKYSFFSHSGPIPEDGYLNEEGIAYSKRELAKLIEVRKESKYNKGRGDINRFYGSNEAYLNNLNDVLLGYIDGSRFRTMQKSSIALKMTNGTGQFIRDYMFPKSEGSIIERLSEQLGAYRDIKEKIDDVKARIDLLTVIQKKGLDLLNSQTELELTKTKLKCVEILDTEQLIQKLELEQQSYDEELGQYRKEKSSLEEKKDSIDKALVEVLAKIQASNVESKKQHLKDLEEKAKLLAGNSSLWRHITSGLRNWETDEVAREFVSNALVDQIHAFSEEKVTCSSCEALKQKIQEEKEEIDSLRTDYNEQKKKIYDSLLEKKQLIDDMKNNRKSYPENLMKAKKYLESRLENLYKKKVKVHVLADLFDITDPEWKDAVEGRLGSVKLCLITEPRYAHNAAVIFQSVKQFEEVTLIHSDAMMKAEHRVLPNSLYEVVETDEEYVKECLKHYMGRIIKCHSVDELENVREGVTPDCYSYSNFIFRHLKRRDYTIGACIGRTVSKEKLAMYEEEYNRLDEKYKEICHFTESLKAIMEFESLTSYDSEHLVQFANAGAELNQVSGEMESLKLEIAKLSQGEYKELEEKRNGLEQEQKAIREQLKVLEQALLKTTGLCESVKTKCRERKDSLTVLRSGYVPNEAVEEEVKGLLGEKSANTIKAHLYNKKTGLETKVTEQDEELRVSRNAYIFKYPTCGFTGAENSNDVYLNKLNDYQKNYEPNYQKEFDKQCKLVYNTLRQNIIAKIHGDIKAAHRHKNEINRMLRDVTFSDSTYQIKIEAARNEDGQFYEMLMAPELDTKNPDYDELDGQISLGDDIFFQKYEHKIQLLTDKFMPPKSDDDRRFTQSRLEMEKYADYRTYLQFNMYEEVKDETGKIIRENYVDDMAGRDSGGEGQNPKYVALMAGFAMLYMSQSNRDSKIKLVLLDEAFSKMDQKRSEVCLKYARKLDLQLIVCVPDERLQSLIRNVDCVYGFRRNKNQISMMHIDKGNYLKMLDGE